MSEFGTHKIEGGGTIMSTSATSEQLAEAFAPKAPKTAQEPESGSESTLVDQGPVLGESNAPEGAEAAEPVKRSEAKKDMKARMLEATQRQAAEKKRADEIEANWRRDQAELQALRERMTKPAASIEAGEKPKVAPVSDADDPAPKEDDFESYAQFVAATARWGARQEHKEISKRTESETQAAQFRDYQIAQVQKFIERAAERAKTEPDLTFPAEVVSLLPQKPFPLDHRLTTDDAIGAYFTTEERGLDLMVYFKDHLDVLARIRTLPPGRVNIELGRIEGRLDGAITATPEKPEVTRANPPVRPVTAVPPSGDDPNKMPDANLSATEWGRKREALEERRRKAQGH